MGNHKLDKFFKAIKSNDIARVEESLNSNVNVNCRDENGFSALHLATIHRYEEIAEILLHEGSDVNQSDSCGFTPLHYAAGWGYDEIGQMLIDFGAHIHGLDKDGNTPLHIASLRGSYKVTALLLDNGANMYIENMLLETPLYLAFNYDHEHIVTLLMNHSIYHTYPLCRSNTTYDNIMTKEDHFSEYLDLYKSINDVINSASEKSSPKEKYA